MLGYSGLKLGSVVRVLPGSGVCVGFGKLGLRGLAPRGFGFGIFGYFPLRGSGVQGLGFRV